MKQDFYTITENKKLTKNVYLMKLSGDTSAITRPGQFINIQLEGRFLRRPISDVRLYRRGNYHFI